MNKPVFIKRNDSARILTDTLTYADGSAVDLTDATVRLVWGGTKKDADIVDATSGSVSYHLTQADVATSGVILLEWEITFNDGSQLTVPTDGQIVLRIFDDLA